MAWVYVLRSLKNNTFYIGSTNNLERRIFEHQAGYSKYTREILPVELVFSQEVKSLKIARKLELWLKKQKSARLIEKIIFEGKIRKLLE